MRLIVMIAAFFGAVGLAQADTVRLCTGGESGNYFAAGKMIQKMAIGLEIQVVETQGTLDNLNRTLDMDANAPEACDAMIGQPDGAVYVARQSPAKVRNLRPVAKLHTEFLHVLCSKKSGVDDLSDLSGSTDYTVAIGEKGSGSWLVWQNIIAEDESYSGVPVSVEGGILAISSVSNDLATCMLVPAGLHNGTVNLADSNFADTVTLIDAQDKDFNDAVDIKGEPLYEWMTIPSGTYRNLQTGFFGSSVDTIGWKAQVYVNVERVSKDTLTKFIATTARAAPGIKAEFDQ